MSTRLLIFAIIVSGGCGGANTSGDPQPASPSSSTPAKVEVAAPAPPAPIQLEDIASKLGVNVVSFSGMSAEKHFPTANGTGVGMLDFDLDGWMDVFVCQGCRFDAALPRPPCALLQSRRGAAFPNVAESANLAVTGYTAGISSADYNSDGFPDIHLTRINEPFKFFVNNGD